MNKQVLASTKQLHDFFNNTQMISTSMYNRIRTSISQYYNYFNEYTKTRNILLYVNRIAVWPRYSLLVNVKWLLNTNSETCVYKKRRTRNRGRREYLRLFLGVKRNLIYLIRTKIGRGRKEQSRFWDERNTARFHRGRQLEDGLTETIYLLSSQEFVLISSITNIKQS